MYNSVVSVSIVIIYDLPTHYIDCTCVSYNTQPIILTCNICYTCIIEGCEKFIFLSFFVALGEKLLLIITKQGKYFFLNFEFV